MAHAKLDPVEEMKVPKGKLPPRRYRVKRGQMISWGGAMTYLAEGAVVSVEGYGPMGIARLHEMGVELEPME